MHSPLESPARIRTDRSNPFAHHTMAVRVPAILDQVLEGNPHLPVLVKASIRELRSALQQNQPLPPSDSSAPDSESWTRELGKRRGQSWLETDWFFAETYAYRQLVERLRYWETLHDPFIPTKKREYASSGHAQALAAALGVSGPIEQRIEQHLVASLFGNRLDLSFQASHARGMSAEHGDLLIDDRAAIARQLLERTGPVHLVLDNAGTELTLDLVLADALLEGLSAPVVLHVKAHPTFVSDATESDLQGFLGIGPWHSEHLWESWGGAANRFRARLSRAASLGRLSVCPHGFWNSPSALWEMPLELEQEIAEARALLLKGDANYRRALNDALWPPDLPFSTLMAGFPVPVAALRMLKSDPIVGLVRGQAEALDTEDPSWRVNGKRGVLALG